MHNNLLIKSANPEYLTKFLNYKNLQVNRVANIIKVFGFRQHNFLVDINLVFSNSPRFFPIDRTQLVNHPIKWKIDRPWVVPTKSATLEQTMKSIVDRYAKKNKKINVFWSGGIDSTAVVTAFLLNLKDRSQLRIIYSPWSHYEHPEYLTFLKKFPEVELIDQSGEVYLDLNLDGIFISGNSSDEIHASIDKSFLETHGNDILDQPWKDFFYKENNNTNFIDFCEQHFSQAGFDIKTVLEARWWFYTSCKIDSILREHTYPFLLANVTNKIDINEIYGFFDCSEYEQYIFFNLDKIIPDNEYHKWKHLLKDYCFKFDQLEEWYNNKTKFHSAQLYQYFTKKVVLNDRRYIFLLENGERIQTPSLPFFSKLELTSKYENSLDYLLNEPDKI
jgi:hypothetical protein